MRRQGVRQWTWTSKFRLANRVWFPLIFVLFALAALTACWMLAPPVRIEHIASALGLAGGFTGFLYAQHAEQTRLFTELFCAFNKRYDRLNGKLNLIVAKPHSKELPETERQHRNELSDAERQHLFDYFNLCAEEFLYYKGGYIDQHVWQAWKNGMEFFARDTRIRLLWQEELKSESYYGFQLPEDL